MPFRETTTLRSGSISIEGSIRAGKNQGTGQDVAICQHGLHSIGRTRARPLATIQHRLDRNALRALNPQVPRSVAAILAGLMAILGILALLAVIFRQ